MKVLIACEYSGIVRDAFITLGHDALSCDILPTEKPGPHYQGDVFDIIDNGFDLMIAHPPCTDLSSAGAAYWPEKQKDGRQQSAIEFVKKLYYSNIPKICIENPVGILTKSFKKWDQIVHPYYFGDNEMKRTCLWLKNLPKLDYDKNIKKPHPKGSCIKSNGRKYNYYYHQGKNSHSRSKFFNGIAKAMAEQWG